MIPKAWTPWPTRRQRWRRSTTRSTTSPRRARRWVADHPLRVPRPAARHLAGEHRSGQVLHHGRRPGGRAEQAGVQPGSRSGLGICPLPGQRTAAVAPQAVAVTTSLGRGAGRGAKQASRPPGSFCPPPSGAVFAGQPGRFCRAGASADISDHRIPFACSRLLRRIAVEQRRPSRRSQHPVAGRGGGTSSRRNCKMPVVATNTAANSALRFLNYNSSHGVRARSASWLPARAS
jgi:hypothetical protein